ncbi:uncharacterized protein LOC133925446 [Phragmites australis]|uniref:uncharacterized protein LOC133925446 n=1 Tax=Phragmites australis TaxID=29695 RepID=UPI002D78F731|nr:uncharacterized protein LOC133925446 [Phragmites australis]
MAANDKDLASSSSAPAPDGDNIYWDLLTMELEKEEKEKAIANDEAIARAVHEEELISKAEGTMETIISDEPITHLLAEEEEMGSDSNTDDGKEEDKDEDLGGDSNTDDEEEEKEEEEMGDNFDTDEEEEEEMASVGGDSDDDTDEA